MIILFFLLFASKEPGFQPVGRLWCCWCSVLLRSSFSGIERNLLVLNDVVVCLFLFQLINVCADLTVLKSVVCHRESSSSDLSNSDELVFVFSKPSLFPEYSDFATLRVTCNIFLFLVFVDLDHLNRGFSDYTTIHDFHLYQQEMFWQIVSTGPSSVFVFGLFLTKFEKKRKTLTHKAFIFTHVAVSTSVVSAFIYLFLYLFNIVFLADFLTLSYLKQKV